jgi:hypothetical protein
MVAGDTFGSAVRASREEIWVRFSNVNTWGAYQCYGNPGFRLHGDGSVEAKKVKRAYLTPHALIADLNNYTQWIRMQMRAKDTGEVSLKDIREEIEKFIKRIPESHRTNWENRADVAAALSFAWGETGAYRNASEWLDKSIRANQGDCPLRAVEQAANFRVRAAASEWDNLHQVMDGTEKENQRRLLLNEVQQALDALDRLVKNGDSIERLNLLGCAYKRQAYIVAIPEGRQTALENMATYYGVAYEKDCAVNARPDPYAFSNWALAKVLLEQIHKSRGMAWKQELKVECYQMIDIARKRYAENPNFWDATAEADCLLVLLLAYPNAAIKKIEEDAKAILSKYKDACLRGTSPRKVASIQEHLGFIRVVQQASHAKINEVLAMIRSSI